MTCPWAPATPIWPIVPRMRSLAPTPTPTSPSMSMRMVRGADWVRVWVARTCSTSLVPMPTARAPKAPWVEVWLSPHTIVMPGWVTPSSGPMMWTIPWRLLRSENSGMPNSAQLRSSASIWAAESGSATPASRPIVGTLWSTVARVRSGRRTRRPASRSPSKACGEVTSCTRWRSTNRIAGPPSSAGRTSWASQTFSKSVRPITPPRPRARRARRGGSRPPPAGRRSRSPRGRRSTRTGPRSGGRRSRRPRGPRRARPGRW